MIGTKIYINTENESYLLKYASFFFSGGEVHIKLVEDEDKRFFHTQEVKDITLETLIKTSDDLMELLLLTDALRFRYGDVNINLNLIYLPYSRQDRRCENNEAFSLRVFCGIINAQKYHKVTVFDSHSDVSPALLNNCVNVEQHYLIGKAIQYIRNDLGDKPLYICSPDAGSLKKCLKISQKYGYDMIRADKIRETKTGKILSTEVYTEHLGDADVLIADDLLDGGGTFIPLANKLREKTNGKIYLYVTHGIFAGGIDKFNGILDKIYCFNIMLDDWKSKDSFNLLRESEYSV